MRFGKYVLRRLVQLIPVLIGVSIIIFSLARVIPGSPEYLYVRPTEQTAEELQAMREYLGLDRPYHIQYITWVRDILRGDLGPSWFTGRTVVEGLRRRLPATIELAAVSMLLSSAFGILMGVLAAAYKDSWLDNINRPIASLGVSVPSFWLGLMLIYFFYYRLRLAPAPIGRIGRTVGAPETVTGLYLVDSVISGNWAALQSTLAHLALPAITLAFVTQASINRTTRAAMLEVLQLDFVAAARANGVPRREVVFGDALRNALLSPLTTIGMIFANLLGGLVVIEQVFAWPGVGRYALSAIEVADYNPVQGFVLVMAIMVVAIYLIVDLLYFAVDPRVRD